MLGAAVVTLADAAKTWLEERKKNTTAPHFVLTIH